MLRDYTGIKPDLYKRYMDEMALAASCTEDDFTRFEYTWPISSVKLPFLDMFLIHTRAHFFARAKSFQTAHACK